MTVYTKSVKSPIRYPSAEALIGSMDPFAGVAPMNPEKLWSTLQ